ncbi:MAG: T9SS type A sorting domain-containing protein [Bacteroidia bacterium]
MKNYNHNSKTKFLCSNLGAVLCLLMSTMFAYSQTVIKAEYSFDNDAGYGKGTSVNLTHAADSTWQLPALSTSGLSKGYHHLYIRTKDSNNKWGQTSRISIEIVPTDEIYTDTIVAAEYFIDTDPKFGKGKKITIPSPDSSITKQFTIPASEFTGKSIGYHTIYGRVKDNLGRWSETFRSRFELIKNEDSTSVVKVEYFFVGEGDAGLGSCHSKTISIAPPFANDSATFYIPYNQLQFNANDTLFLRVRENISNRWSQTASIKGLNITVTPRFGQNIKTASYNVYPNPASNFIKIVFDQNLPQPMNFTLTNMVGEVVEERMISSSETQVSINQPPGIYFVNLKNSKETITRKIVVQ